MHQRAAAPKLYAILPQQDLQRTIERGFGVPFALDELAA